MCECYQIGGPWIAEDPSCETHRSGGLHDQNQELEARLQQALEVIEALNQRVCVLENVLGLGNALKCVRCHENVDNHTAMCASCLSED